MTKIIMYFKIFINFIVIYSTVNCLQVSKVPETTTTVDTTVAPNEIQICTDLTPNYISSRDRSTQTLTCTATICGNNVGDTNPIEFYQPVFDWNNQFGHITVANGTCDYARLRCWHSIDIDIRYFTDEMLDNGLNEIQFSCFVSDSFVTNFGDGVQFVTGNDLSYLKLFKGRRINDDCDNDSQCGENMFCLKSASTMGTVCQCSIDFLTGVQYVQVIDGKYQELVCVPPVTINNTCIYDQQCQAMDTKSVCVDRNDDNNFKCQCTDDTIYYKDSCQSVTESTKSPIVWWIFTTDLNDNNSDSYRFKFLSLRNAAYLMAILAIFLPLVLIMVSILILCYRKCSREQARQRLVKVTFPSPTLRINDLCDIKKEKSDDKYDLVKNDQLEKSMA